MRAGNTGDNGWVPKPITGPVLAILKGAVRRFLLPEHHRALCFGN